MEIYKVQWGSVYLEMVVVGGGGGGGTGITFIGALQDKSGRHSNFPDH